MLHVVLVEPEIPPNTATSPASASLQAPASISSSRWGFRLRKRRCAARAWITGIDPMCAPGRRLKLCAVNRGDARFLFLTKKTKRLYWDEQFQRGDHLVFGRETKGLPETPHRECKVLPDDSHAAGSTKPELGNRRRYCALRSNPAASLALACHDCHRTSGADRRPFALTGRSGESAEHSKGCFTGNMWRRARSMPPPFKSRKAILSAFSDRMAPGRPPRSRCYRVGLIQRRERPAFWVLCLGNARTP